MSLKYYKNIKKYWKEKPINIYKYYNMRSMVIPCGKNYYEHIIAIHFFYKLSLEKSINNDRIMNIKDEICKNFTHVNDEEFVSIINHFNNEIYHRIACNINPISRDVEYNTRYNDLKRNLLSFKEDIIYLDEKYPLLNNSKINF